MYNSNNLNLEPFMLEEINRVEVAFLENIGLNTSFKFTDENVEFTLSYKYDDKTFIVADNKELHDNLPYEAIQAHVESLKNELLADVLRYVIGKTE